ncbi:ABC transporter substrate-binding protein [Phytohabitans kaempferiae]|uniref:ABC transporter substrate-binding protein n=1 Tax=Phytohabitans kaempferiae TaxID=1620943 RepID=A0ABV6MHK5_9ACTN
MLKTTGAAAAATVFAGACSGDSGGTSPSGPATTLTIGQTYGPNSLDPAKTNGALQMYVWPAYEPLVYWAPDGSLQPRLATSWKYVGTGNTRFEMTLRPGVKFSDGSPLNAEVVKANIEYAKQAGGEIVPLLAPIASVEAVDELTVGLSLSEPFPLLPTLFTQSRGSGRPISGEALRRPEKLATESFGAGPYMLDPAATVANDHYAYVPNPHYWDTASVRYEKVVVKILPNPNTALAALKTGQVDVMPGSPTTIEAAKAAGLDVRHAPVSFSGLAFADRTGDLVPALGDVRVRQAINHALDREKITKGLFGEYGAPAQQIVAPGMDGYNDTTFYNYDVARARQLMAEAGYADGFDLPVLTSANTNLMGQAIADELRQIGVRVRISNQAEAANYLKEMATGKFAAYVIGYGMNQVVLMGPNLFLPKSVQFNPRKSSDRQIEAWYQQALAVDDAARGELTKKIVARLAEQAWFAPVTYTSASVYSRSTVSDVQITAQRPSLYPLEWKPATA